MLKRSTALAAAAALTTFLVVSPGSLALSTENDNNLRGRPVGVGGILIDHEEATHDDNSAPSSTFGRVLKNMWNSSKQYTEDNNEPSEDYHNVDDILFSFTLKAPNSNMRQPPRRKLAEAAHAEDAAHGDGHGNDLVVHVTYENIYAILVFLITATAMGIFTSKLGMVSNVMFTTYALCISCAIYTHQTCYM